MAVTLTVGIKSYSQHREHFITRLLERRSLVMCLDEYDELNAATKHSVFSIGYKKICPVNINGETVYCLWNENAKCFTTVYPVEVGSDFYHTALSCFGKKYMPLVESIYNQYKEECATIHTFENIAEAGAYFYKNTVFAGQHMMMYKTGEIDIFKLMHTIKKIIFCMSERVELKVILKP